MSDPQANGLTRRQALGAVAGTAAAAALGTLPISPAAAATGSAPRGATGRARGENASVVPEFWYQDNNLFQGGGIPPDFFSRYDELETWAGARRVMHTFCLAQNTYRKHLIDNVPFLEKMAAAHGEINFSYNVTQAVSWWWEEYKATGVVPDGPPDYTTTLQHLRRLRSAGLHTSDILLQSVLTKPGPGRYLDYGLDRRISDVVEFFEQIRPEFPEVRIGIIDPLPARYEVTWQEAYLWLQSDLAENGHELDSIHFDKPFDRPRNEVTSPAGIKITWDLMVEVSEFVRDGLGITFGLQLADEEAGRISNNAFREYILDGVATYIEHGGRADRYILWPIHPYPDRSVPDYLGALPPEGASQLRLLREVASGPACRRLSY